MHEICLSDHETAVVEALITELDERYPDLESTELLRDLPVHAHRLPTLLRQGLVRFRLEETQPVCLVRGRKVDDASVGTTPPHWNDDGARARTRREDIYLLLCSHLLGETVAWATEQDGRMIHQVLPVAGNEGGQLGTSTDQLHWHTETAFHPERMDYVALLCLRNHDAVPTTYASVDDLDFDAETREHLFRPAYPFLPDESNRGLSRPRDHSAEPTGAHAEVAARSRARVRRMFEEPERVPALFGHPDSPYLRVHPHYIAGFGDDADAEKAFDRLKNAVNHTLRETVLEPGDLLFIDNFKAVHGRREIPGRMDGTDRWLKRAFVVRDLRKSRALRAGALDRVVH
ncbi:guanitoxin biosynthesis L-enduracididine beta-hydroxylase GntD [Streptomyces coelicoflavus]|uniref:guanitoxin biosynthesis L-enduracididine beta-hydroxylase GntD n=1 Tax=Streptomyces coelicoflavus TaxID=285562 RepID=UPI0024AD8BB5|nr:guanitoxin biosynthesis L-enduracididine beta-hydroxylase GntD [Streptomyces coelicoflavus]MDI6520357.1 guanitoxin biosynthesis L-enduracididine beta-hydroxylase GntD [Streptomyces coelicoflavus]